MYVETAHGQNTKAGTFSHVLRREQPIQTKFLGSSSRNLLFWEELHMMQGVEFHSQSTFLNTSMGCSALHFQHHADVTKGALRTFRKAA